MDMYSSNEVQFEQNGVVVPMSPPINIKVKKAKRHSERSSFDEAALAEFFKEAKYPRESTVIVERDAVNLLFESYAARMKQLPKETQSFVKLQMSQIFFNAENPTMQMPISELPQP